MDLEEKDQTLEGYGIYAAVVLMLVYVLNFLDRQLLAVLGEAVKADLQISDSQLGFLFGTAFAVFYAVLGMPLAGWADVGSRKRLIAASVAFWSVMTSLSGFVRNFGELAACRFGVGFGEAGASPASYSLLCDYFPKRLRATAIAIYSIGVNIGSGIGLFLGGAILTAWEAYYPGGIGAPMGLKGWQVAFLGVGAPGLLMTLWILTLREPVRGRYDAGPVKTGGNPFREFAIILLSLLPITNMVLLARAADGRAQVRRQLAISAAGIALVLILIWLTGDIAQWLAVGIGVYGVVSWAQNMSVRTPDTFRSIFGNRAVVLAIASIATVMFSSYAFTFWTIPLYQRLFSAPAGDAGLYLGLANAIGGSAGTLLGGYLGDTFARKWEGGKTYVMLANIVLSASFGLLMLLSPDKSTFVVVNALYLFMVALGVAPYLSFVAEQVPAHARATATAFTLLCTNLVGFAIGPYFIGKASDLIAGANHASAQSLQLAMLLSLVAAPIAAFLAWRSGHHYRAATAKSLDAALHPQSSSSI